MKNIKIAGIAALAAVLLVGCGEQPVNETSSSSVESSTRSSSSSSNSNTSKPTSSSSGGNISSSSSSSSSSSTSYVTAPTSKNWNPDAPGNTPGPYGGYYDANGKLHAIKANVPKDSYGYPVVSYEDEYGSGHLTKTEMEAYIEEERRISEKYRSLLGL